METLKELKGMILGYATEVYTDCLNIVHKTTVKAPDRVMRWILLLEDLKSKPSILRMRKMLWMIL